MYTYFENADSFIIGKKKLGGAGGDREIWTVMAKGRNFRIGQNSL